MHTVSQLHMTVTRIFVERGKQRSMCYRGSRCSGVKMGPLSIPGPINCTLFESAMKCHATMNNVISRNTREKVDSKFRKNAAVSPISCPIQTVWYWNHGAVASSKEYCGNIPSSGIVREWKKVPDFCRCVEVILVAHIGTARCLCTGIAIWITGLRVRNTGRNP